MDRAARVSLLAVAFVLLAGCQAPSTHDGGSAVPGGPGSVTPTTEANPAPDGRASSQPTTGTAGSSGGDRLGVEGGYDANATLAINETDGLNASELEAVTARAMARVEVVRGIEFEEPVPVTVISRAEYRERHAGSSGVRASRRAYENAMYEALFLIGEDEDAVSVRRRSFGSVVLGFYSPGRDEIVLVSEGGTPTASEAVLAHELVHALQYRHLGVDRFARSTFDGSNAVAGLVEGDARYVDALYSARCAEAWSCVRSTGLGGGGGGDFRFELYFLSFFPYSDGPAFVRGVHEAGGWAAVNALYDRPPASGEQVTAPGRYPDERPREVALPDRSSTAWSPVTIRSRSVPDTLGQPAIAAMFAHPTFDGRSGLLVPSSDLINRDGDRLSRADAFEYGFAYADGWAGDAFRVYESRDGDLAYVWRIAWDSPAEAREFAEGYRALLAYWGGVPANDSESRVRIPEGASPYADAFSVVVSGDAVTIVNAPSTGDLRSVVGDGPADALRGPIRAGSDRSRTTGSADPTPDRATSGSAAGPRPD